MENLCGHMLIPVLLFSLCLRTISHGAAALSFNYNFSIQADLESPDLQYIKDSSRAGDRINLTNGTQQNSTGRVYHRLPVRLWNGRKRASFTTSFTFAIGGVYSNDRGDGMAFFVGPPRLPPDSQSMFLGLFANDSGESPRQTVGVEFDTCRNIGTDPEDTIDHIGIDINNISSGPHYARVHNRGLYGTMSATITYHARSTMMTVSLELSDGSTYSVEAPVDFRGAGVPQDANVGFSAATGVLSESHQLLSWSFSATDPSSSNMVWAILVSVASASLVGLVAALLWIVKRRQQPPMVITVPVARKFSYRELSAATGNFSKDRLLGAGAFGEVYRGELGMLPVAVKRLTRMWEQTRRDYVTEITTLCQLSHRNIVRLVGWCDGGGDDKLLLVYELVTNRSLDKHLYPASAGARGLLAWPERYGIVRGIGSAIEYLHTGPRNPILHRDIKPSNVMLDDAFQAKLGDFGLVRQVWSGQSSLRDTAMVGSLNYMDPECITTGTVSTASDMYSFGVLLLEVATGKKPVVLPDHASPTNALVNAVRSSYARGAVLEMADDRLNDFDRAQMERVLLVGLLCVHKNRHNRPGIRDAVNLLSNLGHPVPQVLL